MDINEKIKYRQTLAELDVPVMDNLCQSGNYNYSLYIGHLILEKILKAHFVKVNLENPPRTHDLLKLVQNSKIEIDDKLKSLLMRINTFNIEARYPDEKLSFYLICTKEFAETNIEIIKELYQWLKSQI
jgi:HEPN domain-containing protein